MQGKSRVAAGVIVILACACLVAYLGFSQARMSVERMGLMRVDGERLMLMFGQQLLWLNPQGEEVEHLNFTDLGLTVAGDPAVFADGSLLLYQRPESPSLVQNIRNFLRLQDQPKPASRSEGFRRCWASECRPFATDLPALQGSFRVLIEPDSQRVHVADTGAFRLYLVDEQGQLLARSDDQQLRFPNQMHWLDGELWVADTNHQRLALIQHLPEAYGQVLASLPVKLSNAYQWPNQMTFDGQYWWVNVGDHALSKGQLAKLDPSGKLLEHARPQGLDDPLAIAWFAERLWLNDFESSQLFYQDEQGTWQPVQSAPTLRAWQQASAEQSAFWQLWERLAIAAGVLVFIAGLVASWVLEKRQTKAFFIGSSHSHVLRGISPDWQNDPQPLPKGQVIWLDNHLWRWRRFWQLPLLLLIGVIAWLSLQARQESLFFCVAGLIAVLLLSATFINLWQISRQRLGLLDEQFLLEQSPVQRIKVKPEQLCYRGHVLWASDVSLSLRSGFDRRQLAELVFPRLRQAQQGGWLDDGRALWRSRNPMLFAAFGSVFAVLLMAGYLGLLSAGLLPLQ